VLDGAQSKDPDGAYLLVLFGAFQPPQPVSVSARYANKQGTWEGFTMAASACSH
jgi:hypothetical protein